MKNQFIFKRLLKYALLPGVIFQPRRPGLIVLAYHRIGANVDMELDIPTSFFEQQLKYLVEYYDVVTLDKGLETLTKLGEPLEKDMVALTFDDGYSDFYENAFPLLSHYKVPATIYLSTHYIETGENFPWDKSLDKEKQAQAKPISWKQLEEITASGLITLGSHTHTHPNLNSLALQEIERELATSKQLIQKRLGINVEHFCYPGGVFSDYTEVAVSKHFKSAAIGGRRKNIYPINAYHIYRVPSQKSDDFQLFKTNLRGGGVFLEALATARKAIL